MDVHASWASAPVVPSGGLTWPHVRWTNTRNSTVEAWEASGSDAMTGAIASSLASGGCGEALTVVAFKTVTGAKQTPNPKSGTRTISNRTSETLNDRG